MNSLLVCASLLLIAVGVIHSILGEILIFNKLRNTGILPTITSPPLQLRNLRIIWATWHLASVFGFAIAAIIFFIADSNNNISFILNVIAWFMVAASAIVFYASKAKHPGWFGLLGVAILTWLA